MTWNQEQPLDREIRQALADLPRDRADDGFTDRVLRRLDEIPPQAPRDPWRPWPHFRWQPVLAGAAFAALLVVALLAAGILRPSQDPTQSPVQDARASESPQPVFAAADGPGAEGPSVSLPPTAAQETDEPRRDTRSETVARLEELRQEHTRLVRDLRGLRELAEGSQVIYIGGDESLDFVLDLQPEQPTGGAPDIRPATHRGGSGGGSRL